MGDIMDYEEIENIFKKLNVNPVDSKSKLHEVHSLKNSYTKQYVDIPKKNTKKNKKIIIWNFLPNKEV